MTDLQRTMIIAYIITLLEKNTFFDEGELAKIYEITDRELSVIGEYDHELEKTFTEMARELYEELIGEESE